MTPPFGAVTNFEGRDAVVSLRGGVDDVAAFELEAVLDAAIDREPASMVLELAEPGFIGAAGLVVIANAERRLATMGVALRIQSPSAAVNRLLGMVERAGLERVLPGAVISGPSSSTGLLWYRSGSGRACRRRISDEWRGCRPIPTSSTVRSALWSSWPSRASVTPTVSASRSYGTASCRRWRPVTRRSWPWTRTSTPRARAPASMRPSRGTGSMPNHSIPRPAGRRSLPGPGRWGSRRSCPRRCAPLTNPSAR